MAEQEQVPQALLTECEAALDVFDEWREDQDLGAITEVVYPLIKQQVLREVEEALRRIATSDEIRAVALTAFDAKPSLGFQRSFDEALTAAFDRALATLSDKEVDEEVCERCGGSGKKPKTCDCRPGLDGGGWYHETDCASHGDKPCSACGGTGKKATQVDEAESSETREAERLAKYARRRQHTAAHGPTCECRAFEVESVIAETPQPTAAGETPEAEETPPKSFAELRKRFVDPEKEQLRAELARFREKCQHVDTTLNGDGTMTCDLCGHTEPDPFYAGAQPSTEQEEER